MERDLSRIFPDPWLNLSIKHNPFPLGVSNSKYRCHVASTVADTLAERGTQRNSMRRRNGHLLPTRTNTHRRIRFAKCNCGLLNCLVPGEKDEEIDATPTSIRPVNAHDYTGGKRLGVWT